jgi:hypothetical protein
MRLAFTALIVCAFTLRAQDPAQVKHMSVSTMTNARPLLVSALEIERGLPYPAVMHLKGSVEIKTPVCLNAGPNRAQYCDGYIVLRADEADLHEDSGQIDPRGKVTVTREK